MGALQGRNSVNSPRQERNRYFTDGRRDRLTGQRGSAALKDGVHYRKDYGTTMTDGTYTAVEEDRVKFEDGISKARGEIQKNEKMLAGAREKLAAANGQLQGAYASSLGKINAGVAAAEGQIGHYQTAQIRLYNGGNHEATYNIAASALPGFINGVHEFNKKNSSDIAFWGGDGYHYIDVKGYGKEWHDQLRTMQNTHQAQWNASATKARGEIYSQRNKAMGALQGSYNKAMGQIKVQEGIIDQSQSAINSKREQIKLVTQERQKNLNGIRQQYAQRLARIKETIMGSVAKKNKGGK